MHAGEWLSLDRIVDDLWSDEATPGAARTVQTYISQLRPLLAEAGARIPARGGGYALDLPAEAVDAWRFERDVRAAGAITDPQAQVAHLTDALSAWQGEPLEEFDQPWAVRARPGCTCSTSRPATSYLDARLTSGAGADLVPELERLVEDHPLDERFWSKLVLAYYRGGQQAGALRAFQRARSTLAGELGIEPGPELVALERRVLDQDPSLLPAVIEPVPSVAGRAQPSGTVTVLFTDIADSTRLWETEPGAMREAVSASQVLLTSTIEAGGGHVVKSTGDGLMAVFADAPRALQAAADGQRAVAAACCSVPLQVRMGLHTGSADVDADGDYHGPTVNRAARIGDTAHPRQILVSEATAALGEGVDFRDLGEHRLKGLAPLRLLQVLGPGLHRDFPPTTTTSRVGLPTPASSFVGRTVDLDAVATHVGAHRLVTLTGVGGCGKTRLAIEVARRLADGFADGARFVDLAATDDEGVEDAVVDALGLASSLGTAAAGPRLVAYLAERELLLVLDNCEHVLDHAAELVEAVLGQPGATRVLATSREPLGVLGEQVVLVSSLEIESEAVRLFLERADAAGTRFAGDDHRDVVTQICRRLDGIPLAIELAAAHTTHLAPSQLLERLDNRFLLLTGGPRRIQRQQTLAATLDWSHDLLAAEDRATLRHLAAFPASFTLEAAEAVTGRADIVERLGALTTKSLVQVIDDDRGPRYRLLEPVRLYAEAKLVDSGEAAETRTRHRDWVDEYLGAKPLGERWLGDTDLLATMLPSVRAAVDWSFALHQPGPAARIASGVDWSRTEASAECERWCHRLLDEPSLPPELRATVLLTIWWLGPLGNSATYLTTEFASDDAPMEGAVTQQVLAATEGMSGPLRAVAHAAAARDWIFPAVSARDPALRRAAIDAGDRGVELSAGADEPWPLICRMLAGMVHASFLQPEVAHEHFAAGTPGPAPPSFRGLHTLTSLRLIPTRPPPHWEADVVLVDGGTVHVRPIRPDDGDRLRAFHEGLSPESIHYRFFSPHPRLTDAEVDHFTVVDHVDRVALVATLGDRIVGVARYDRLGDRRRPRSPSSSRCAPGTGCRRPAAGALGLAARERGITRFEATDLSGTADARGCSARPASTRPPGVDAGVIEVELLIEPTEAYRAAIGAPRAPGRGGVGRPVAAHPARWP